MDAHEETADEIKRLREENTELLRRLYAWQHNEVQIATNQHTARLVAEKRAALELISAARDWADSIAAGGLVELLDKGVGRDRT